MKSIRPCIGGQYRSPQWESALSLRALLDAFEKAGYISFIQRDAMTATLEVGHAAMRRAYRPTEEDMKVALDIVEGVMAPLYHHQSKAEKMVERVPPRPPRKQ
jgi:hypothetical protein